MCGGHFRNETLYREHCYYWARVRDGTATEDMTRRFHAMKEAPIVSERELYHVFGDPYNLRDASRDTYNL